MTNKHLVFIYIVGFTPIAFSWTIDLPEIRRHLFESNDMKKGYEIFGNQEQFFYDNIDGNSKHNSKGDHTKYATKLGYPFDMAQKVASVAEDGGRYLEGLRRSIESYTGMLGNCSRVLNNSSMSQNGTSNSTWLPRVGQSLPADDVVPEPGRAPASCAEVTRAGEHVRRLAEMATWTTQRLQDLAYAEIYQKDVSEEEDELIFKLASFLDRLARLTGFRPNPKKFLTDPPVSTISQPSTEVPPLANLVGAPEEVKNALMECLKQNSAEPATVRCAYPLPFPPALAAIFNLTNITTSPSSDALVQTPAEGQPLSRELLLGSDSPAFTGPASGNPVPNNLSFNSTASLPDSNPYLQSIRKRSLSMPYPLPPKQTDGDVHFVKKRSIDENPTVKLMKYYVKHEVGMNSNPGKNHLHFKIPKTDNFNVNNDLSIKYLHKRSLFRRKAPAPHFRLPLHTLKQVKERLKETLGTRYYKNRQQIIKIKNALDSIRSITYKNSVTKANIHKRSIHYEDMSRPKASEDPTQDLSYYVKNKEGTNISPDLLQAARVRLGLEQVFQTGNIEVVRRYGANYNPLVPAPFYAGIIKSIADI